MPVYEYRCHKCGNRYEKREGFDAPSRQKCPKCRGRATRVLQAAPIVFKGSGFYVTDSRKEPVSEPSGGESDGPSDSDTEAAAAG